VSVTDPDSHTKSNRNPDGHTDSDSHTKSNSNPDGDTDSDSDSDSYGYCYHCAYGDADCDGVLF
jgi:hypothetical protein